MNSMKAAVATATLGLALAGCTGTKTTPEPSRSTAAAPTPAPATPVTFVNTVWQVAESNAVAPGQLYVFLSEGTLVIASKTGKPSLGTWSNAEGNLTMVEEGIPYQVEQLDLSRDAFRIRIHNPGEPVEIRFVRADASAPS